MRGDNKALDMHPLIMTVHLSHHVWNTGKMKSVIQRSSNLILIKASGKCPGILFQIVIFMAKAHNFEIIQRRLQTPTCILSWVMCPNTFLPA